MNLRKELTKLVDKEVEVTMKKSNSTNVNEFMKDETTIARLKNIYDTRDLLLELYDNYEEDTELMERVKKYSLGTVFAEVYDLNNCYIEYYNSGDDDWLVWINDALDYDFPLQQVNE